MQTYRSGHNGADSKSVREQSPASSNLAVCATPEQSPLCSGARVQVIPPKSPKNFFIVFRQKAAGFDKMELCRFDFFSLKKHFSMLYAPLLKYTFDPISESKTFLFQVKLYSTFKGIFRYSSRCTSLFASNSFSVELSVL